jgi:uncharacterized protein YjbJ (UPF0337 family)
VGDRADLGTNRCPLTPRSRQIPKQGPQQVAGAEGQVKEAGQATDNPRLGRGRADQTKANLKQAAERAKDTLRPAADSPWLMS